MNEKEFYDAADRDLADQESALDKKSRDILLEMQYIADGHETRPTVEQPEQEMEALELKLDSIYEEMHKISKTREELWKKFQKSQEQARKPKVNI